MLSCTSKGMESQANTIPFQQLMQVGLGHINSLWFIACGSLYVVSCTGSVRSDGGVKNGRVMQKQRGGVDRLCYSCITGSGSVPASPSGRPIPKVSIRYFNMRRLIPSWFAA